MAGTTQSDIAGITNRGSYDAYLAVMNNDGTVAWELSKGGPGNDYCYNAKQTDTYSPHSHTVNVSTLPNGVYFITVNRDGITLAIEKILKP